MFLQALAGTRRVLGAAAWATCTLLGSRADARFPLSVRVHSGEEVVLSVVRLTVLAAHSFHSPHFCLPGCHVSMCRLPWRCHAQHCGVPGVTGGAARA